MPTTPQQLERFLRTLFPGRVMISWAELPDQMSLNVRVPGPDGISIQWGQVIDMREVRAIEGHPSELLDRLYRSWERETELELGRRYRQMWRRPVGVAQGMVGALQESGLLNQRQAAQLMSFPDVEQMMTQGALYGAQYGLQDRRAAAQQALRDQIQMSTAQAYAQQLASLQMSQYFALTEPKAPELPQAPEPEPLSALDRLLSDTEIC